MNITDEIRDALLDVDYPASKEQLLAAAQRRNAGDEIVRGLRALPPVDYRSEDEVLASIGTHPADLAGRSASDKGRQSRDQDHPGVAEHLRDVEPTPIERTVGWNRGS